MRPITNPISGLHSVWLPAKHRRTIRHSGENRNPSSLGDVGPVSLGAGDKPPRYKEKNARPTEPRRTVRHSGENRNPSSLGDVGPVSLGAGDKPPRYKEKNARPTEQRRTVRHSGENRNPSSLGDVGPVSFGAGGVPPRYLREDAPQAVIPAKAGIHLHGAAGTSFDEARGTVCCFPGLIRIMNRIKCLKCCHHVSFRVQSSYFLAALELTGERALHPAYKRLSATIGEAKSPGQAKSRCRIQTAKPVTGAFRAAAAWFLPGFASSRRR